MNQKSTKLLYVKIVCAAAALGGLLFGLDQGFINGSLTYITKAMNLTVAESESFASIMLIGCIFGCLISGFIARKFGRKYTLLATAVMFTIFSLWGSLAGNLFVLSATRFCLGIAVGVASFAVPLYLSEIAPTKYQLFSLSSLSL